MLLKRLQMQGFKSFADKTVLDFSNGATAVVGPNGSGKSNISDAIRWVIGETRAKSLRGGSMQDVIFSGTETRKQLNYAEVSLVLDNSSHIFPLDYEEIVVTRRLYRSGESEYMINKSKCLLKNIHELFMDTGLGRNGYSIIGQGNVAQILSTKAEDRRSLFEEAAGVSKYKYRKDEALRKLSHTEENLVRINDIVSELEGQINPLKRQSEKARKYLEYYGEYKDLDINLSVVNLDKNEENKEKANTLYNSVNDELASLREQETETESKINNLYTENKKLDEVQSEKNSLLVENEAKVSNNANEIAIAQNNIKNNNSMLLRIDDEIKATQARNQDRKRQIEELEKTIEDKNQEAQAILGSFDEIKGESDDLDKRQRDLHDEIERVRTDAISSRNLAVSQREKIAGIEQLRTSYIERRTTLEAEIRSFKEGITKTQEEIDRSFKEIKEKKEKHKKISQSVDSQNEKADKLKAELSDINTRLNDLQVEYNSKVSHKQMLEAMENSYEGYAKSVKAVLKAPELKTISIYGTLSGLVEVKNEYITAIETVLGNALQNIVVETENDAKTAIEYLRETRAGRATFLPVTSVKGRKLDNIDKISREHGFIGIASDLVDSDKKYRGIVENLLGKTVVVRTIDDAITISKSFGYKFRIVTLEGDITNPGGSMTGGSVNKHTGFLSRSADIKNLGKEIRSISQQIDSSNEKADKLNKDIQLVEDQLSSYIPLMREYEDEILRLENTVEHLKDSILQTDQNDARAQELNNLEQTIKETSDEVALLLSAVRKSENDADALDKRVSELEEEYNRAVEEKDEKSKGLMDKTLELAGLENAIKTAKASIGDINSEIERETGEISVKIEDKERIHSDNDNLYTLIRQKEKMANSIREISDTLRNEIKEIDAKKADISDALSKIQNSNKDLTDRLLNLQQELSRAEARLEKLSSERENIINHLWDEYEITYSDALASHKELEDVKEASQRLTKLKGQIKALGSVNVDAIEEYKAIKERYEFLSTQKADLEKSKVNLNKIINSMDDLMREHFDAQFREINTAFGEVFKELFGGGRGRLYLSEPDNVLESGIEIEVQLPGKGLQNLNLYSGGEKSFIAIALLFAILKVKPTPFCILDEIDAALDDVNVSRFATYLKNYTDSTQFIVITHRRGSMEAANILYGVTMQEKGVSKLLSLHIDDVEDELIG